MLTAEESDRSEADREGGFGGGTGVGDPSANGEEKKACVLLTLDFIEKDGEERGDETCMSETEDDVRTLSCEERVEELESEEDDG